MNEDRYQVLCGNEYLKTSQVVIPFNITSRGAYIDDCDIIVTMRHLRLLSPGDDLYSVKQCLSHFYAKWDIAPLLSDSKKYITYDGEDLTRMKKTDKKYRDTIYNNCNLNDVSFHGSTLQDVIFLNCDIDILDLRHTNLVNVSFLHCDKTYALKLDHARFKNVIFKKTSIPKDLTNLVKKSDGDYFVFNSAA
jgi:hypothetical protein